ncbi:unnamed protein product, partial [Protopolystoma xenopodis]
MKVSFFSFRLHLASSPDRRDDVADPPIASPRSDKTETTSSPAESKGLVRKPVSVLPWLTGQRAFSEDPGSPVVPEVWECPGGQDRRDARSLSPVSSPWRLVVSNSRHFDESLTGVVASAFESETASTATVTAISALATRRTDDEPTGLQVDREVGATRFAPVLRRTSIKSEPASIGFGADKDSENEEDEQETDEVKEAFSLAAFVRRHPGQPVSTVFPTVSQGIVMARQLGSSSLQHTPDDDFLAGPMEVELIFENRSALLGDDFEEVMDANGILRGACGGELEVAGILGHRGSIRDHEPILEVEEEEEEDDDDDDDDEDDNEDEREEIKVAKTTDKVSAEYEQRVEVNEMAENMGSA